MAGRSDVRAWAVVPCAGAGSRLGGADKAALRLADGRPFVSAIADGRDAALPLRLAVLAHYRQGRES